MNYHNLKKLEKLLNEFLFHNCINGRTIEYLQEGPAYYSDEHLRYIDNVIEKTKSTKDCLTCVREAIKFIEEDE